MRRILLLLFCPASVALLGQGQNAVYPAAVVTPAQLTPAADGILTYLAVPMGTTDTQIQVGSAAGIPLWAALTIDKEMVQVCAIAGNVLTLGHSSCPNIDGRGFAGTQKAAHAANVTPYNVGLYITAQQFNQSRLETMAIEGTLGPRFSGGSNINTAFIFPPQTPGGSLAPGLSTITMTPVPPGVNGTDTAHYLYVSGGAGSAEACLISGGTGTAGQASGQIIIQCNGSHAAGWTIQTATAGISEGLQSLTPNGGLLWVAPGSFTLHAPVQFPGTTAGSPYSLLGTTMDSSVLNVATDFPLSAQGVFSGVNGNLGSGPELGNMTIGLTQPDSASISAYTHWPPVYFSNSGRSRIHDLFVLRAWDVITLVGNPGGTKIVDVEASHLHNGITIDGPQDSMYLDRVRFWPYGMTTNQVNLYQATTSIIGLNLGVTSDLHVTDYFALCPTGVNFYNSVLGSQPSVIVSFSNLSLDGAAFIMNPNTTGGWVQINGGYISRGLAAAPVQMSTGRLEIQGFTFFPGGAGPGPFVSQTGGILQVTDSWFYTSGFDDSTIASSGSGTSLMLSNNFFNRASGQTYTQPTISVGSGARATIIGNRSTDLGTGGTGTFIAIANDDHHFVWGNSFVGWSSSYPAAQIFGTYQDSNGATMAPANMRGGLGYIATESGQNNAIAAPYPINVLFDGLTVSVRLAHTLQNGALNTFNLAGTGTLPIRSMRNWANYIAAGYAVGAIITLRYDSAHALWQDVSQ
jgi:hypothetical protein